MQDGKVAQWSSQREDLKKQIYHIEFHSSGKTCDNFSNTQARLANRHVVMTTQSKLDPYPHFH